MRLSCLVNNYNYGRFVADAVRGALDQTVPFDEVIVVDDGSTDDSSRLLAGIAARHPRVTVIEKANGGQLSCFEEGFARSTGDVVFFLDADDRYEPDYVERMLAVYSARPDVGFAFCGERRFGGCEGVRPPQPQDRDLGCSAVATALARRSVGAPTSCLSMRRWVLERVLPGPPRSDWRICADACLVYGSSLAGARKYAVAAPLVRRRLHGANAFATRRRDTDESYRRHLRVAGLIGGYAARFGLDEARVAPLVRNEFRTIPRPTRRELNQYAQIVLNTRQTIGRQAWQLSALLKHYAATRRSGDAQPSHGETIPLARYAEPPRRWQPAA